MISRGRKDRGGRSAIGALQSLADSTVARSLTWGRIKMNSWSAGRSYERIEPYEDFYWTPTLLAAKLHVAEKTIWRWIREGRLRANRCFESRIPHCRSSSSVARPLRARVLARGLLIEDCAGVALGRDFGNTVGCCFGGVLVFSMCHKQSHATPWVFARLWFPQMPN